MAEKSAKKEILSQRRFVKVAPDKMRRAAKLVQGKKLTAALSILEFSHLASAVPLIQTLKQTAAIAKSQDIPLENLLLKNILVNEGPKLKRRRIIHQGKATDILKRMSHIIVVLTDAGNPKSLPRRQAGEIRNPKQKINHQNPKVKK